MPRYVIVGGGAAGTTAAQNLRRLDPAAAVTLVGDEPYPYYYRPKLWEFLEGRIAADALYFRPPEWYAGQNITLRLDAHVRSLQPQEHRIQLADGKALDYDRLLLATGACSFVPDIPGAKLPGVFVLRTLQDATAMRAQAARSKRAIVVGGGLLGLETAHALAALNLHVTVVEIAPHLLPRQLDREGSRFFQARLEKTGLSFITGARTAAVTGESSATGIRLEDGRAMSGELILFSAGVVPRVELARDAGLAVNRGIVVDSLMRTGDPDVFAAGDAAEAEGRTYGLVPPAVEQARTASQNMAGGEPAVYHGTLSSATLKLMGMELTSLGEATVEDPSLTVHRTADEAAGIYRKVVVSGGAVVGAILLNDTASVPLFRQLISSRQDVSSVQDRLLDPGFDLRGLLQPKAK
jgi:nitrite reductase (NADH) large subunit